MGSASIATKKRGAVLITCVIVLAATAVLSALIHPVAGFGLGLILATQALFALEAYCERLDAQRARDGRKPAQHAPQRTSSDAQTAPRRVRRRDSTPRKHHSEARAR